MFANCLSARLKGRVITSPRQRSQPLLTPGASAQPAELPLRQVRQSHTHGEACLSPVPGPHAPEQGPIPAHTLPRGSQPEGFLAGSSCKTPAGLEMHCPNSARSAARMRNIISKTCSCFRHQFHGCSCLVALTFSYRHHQLIKPPETDPGIKPGYKLCKN